MVTNIIKEDKNMPVPADPTEKINTLKRKIDLSHINNPIDMTIAYL